MPESRSISSNKGDHEVVIVVVVVGVVTGFGCLLYRGKKRVHGQGILCSFRIRVVPYVNVNARLRLRT